MPNIYQVLPEFFLSSKSKAEKVAKPKICDVQGDRISKLKQTQAFTGNDYGLGGNTWKTIKSSFRG